jgi:hypothetical protein
MNNFATCPNCGHKIGCSCSGGSQIQTAFDGKTVCSACMNVYETKIKLQVLQSTKSNES